MLAVLDTIRLLRLTRPGRLQPWLGPALRGLAGRRLKGRVCRQPLPLQNTLWRYCKNPETKERCPHLFACAYRLTLESEPPLPIRFSWQEDGTRAVVIAPVFPLPERAEAGFTFPVRVTFIGNAASACVEDVWRARAEGGLDPDHMTFDVLPPPPESALRRDLVESPTRADLFEASLHLLENLHDGYAGRLPDDHASLKEAARGVATAESGYRAFAQKKHSYRSGEVGWVKGVVGHGVYADVPLSVARWLAWGGRLHVGPYRVAGAGGCRLWWRDPAANGEHEWHALG